MHIPAESIFIGCFWRQRNIWTGCIGDHDDRESLKFVKGRNSFHIATKLASMPSNLIFLFRRILRLFQRNGQLEQQKAHTDGRV
jgi:hypothetical protein